MGLKMIIRDGNNKNVVINDLVVNQNLETINNYSPENTLKNIFTDQPDF